MINEAISDNNNSNNNNNNNNNNDNRSNDLDFVLLHLNELYSPICSNIYN